MRLISSRSMHLRSGGAPLRGLLFEDIFRRLSVRSDFPYLVYKSKITSFPRIFQVRFCVLHGDFVLFLRTGVGNEVSAFLLSPHWSCFLSLRLLSLMNFGSVSACSITVWFSQALKTAENPGSLKEARLVLYINVFLFFFDLSNFQIAVSLSSERVRSSYSQGW